MYYGQIITHDVANGPGLRLSLFVSGCSRHCKGCFNEQTWDPEYGQEFTKEVKESLLKEYEKPYYHGITILGGEPFEKYNKEEILSLLTEVKELHPYRNIWIYSGCLYENLMENEISRQILDLCDILVDGPFILDQRDLMLSYRGSANQRVIDLKKSSIGNVVLSPYMKKGVL